MSAPINQIQSPDDEDEDPTEERYDVVYNCKNKDSAMKEPVQGSFLRYYNHSFGQAQDLACFGAVSTASNPLKISHERIIKGGFDLPSPKMKANKRKAEVVDGGGAGGRVVRATGRKDRHSKVRTARGPRDRRVRLSPRTAIQFYDVQDRLGYDRPSKAIDWLINEAKSAIDAVEEQASIKFSDSNQSGGFSLSQHGMREKQERLNDEGLGPSFSYNFGALEAYLDEDLRSARNRSESIYPADWEHGFWLETNWELQKSGNERGGGDVDLLSQREPLQSSSSEFNFSNELWKIAASATCTKQDQNLLFSMPSTNQG